MMESCYCCGKLVSEGEEKKRRRALNTQNSQPFLETLTSLIANHVKDVAVDISQLHTGYLCRSCNDMITNLHKKVDAKLSVAISILPKITPEVGSRSGASSGTSRASARQSAAARLQPSVASSSNSPQVAVSTTLIMYSLIYSLHYRQLFTINPDQDYFPLHLAEGVYVGPL